MHRRRRCPWLPIGAAACLAVASPAARATDWPTAAHDNARSGRSPDTFGGPNLRELWNRTWPDTQFATRTGPIVVGSTVYIGAYTGDFFALNLTNGSEVWKAKVGGPVVNTAAAAGGVVYVPSLDGRLYALDAATGTERWRFRARAGFWASPAVENGVVYIGSLDGRFYAIRDGQKLWEFAAGVPIRQTAALEGGTVYFGAEDMKLYALATATGAPAWVSPRVVGASYREYWPVVTPTLVITRTTPMYHIAQQATTNYAQSPQHETIFAFRRSDGQKAFQVLAAHASGCGAASAPPVLGPDGTTMYVLLGGTLGIGRLDLGTGQVARAGNINGPTDETYVFSASADNKVFIVHQDILAYFNTATNTSTFAPFGAPGSLGSRDRSAGHDVVEWSRNAWHGPAQAPVAIAGNRIVWAAGGYVVAVGP